ncbi:unnamed protein product [Allacma fusca]|uniref:Uncharacterized protein n=2 Tax=Allacma fusca TaxID=39272 RepID=A0A8J2LJM7_9HEXA|nr:unnamed protein product [Allacma fusca]
MEKVIKLSLIISIAINAVLIGLVSTQVEPRLTLFAGKNWTGLNLSLLSQDRSELEPEGFDNMAQSLCAVGTWLFYDLPYYNANETAYMNYLHAPNGTSIYCSNFDSVFSNKTSSIRFVGSPKSITAETLTLYAKTYFQGQSEYFTGDYSSPSLSETVSSLIITGSSPWTVFDRKGYSGTSWCIVPSGSNETTPAFVVDIRSQGIPHGTIRSFKKGCLNSTAVEVNIQKISPGLHRGGILY